MSRTIIRYYVPSIKGSYVSVLKSVYLDFMKIYSDCVYEHRYVAPNGSVSYYLFIK